MDEILKSLNIAADVHKKVRNWIQHNAKPGIPILYLCQEIEKKIHTLLNYDCKNPLKCGIAFPIGISLNNCAAHYTPSNDDTTVLSYDDVCKFDLGVHVNGYIIDSAFTMAFDHKYDKLIECAKDALETGIKNSGNDAILGEIGEKIQEVIESYSYKSIEDISGHNLGCYKIHNGKAVPNIKIDYNLRMQPNEFYAIEPYPSTGTGNIISNKGTSHYMLNLNKDITNLPFKELKLYDILNNNFSSLAFCPRWIKPLASQNIINKFDHLIKHKYIEGYPELYDIQGSKVAQFEHTIFIKESGIDILSKGDDY